MNYITLQNKSTGETVSFNNRNEAADFFNCTPSAISRVRAGRNKSIYRTWVMVDEPNSTKDKPCTVVYSHGRRIEFASQQEAADHLGVSKNAVSLWARGAATSRKGIRIES